MILVLDSLKTVNKVNKCINNFKEKKQLNKRLNSIVIVVFLLTAKHLLTTIFSTTIHDPFSFDPNQFEKRRMTSSNAGPLLRTGLCQIYYVGRFDMNKRGIGLITFISTVLRQEIYVANF